MTTLSQIAADVRRLAGEQPPFVVWDSEDPDDVYTTDAARDETDRLALIGAMVLATYAARGCRPRYNGECWCVRCPKTGVYHVEHDRDHSNDPLLSLHAAFLWAKEAH